MTVGLDPSGKDTGNLVFFEHINLRVPDQVLATAFYVSALVKKGHHSPAEAKSHWGRC